MIKSKKSKKSRTKSIAKRAERLCAEISSIRRRLSNLEEDFDSVVQNLIELLLEVGAVSTSTHARLSDGASGSPADLQKRLLARISAGGVSSLVLKRCPKRHGIISIENSPCFELPELPTDLLEILADKQGEGAYDPDFPPWKGIKEIARRLEEIYGRSFSKHTIVQNISRLRKLLLDRGDVNPGLVQTNNVNGYRFALRLS